jgi:hypothetical protein
MDREICKVLKEIVWYLIPRSPVEAHNSSGGELTASKQQLACSDYSSTLNMEAVLFFETSVH